MSEREREREREKPDLTHVSPVLSTPMPTLEHYTRNMGNEKKQGGHTQKSSEDCGDAVKH